MSAALSSPQDLHASSSKLSDKDVQDVEKAAIDSEEEQKQRQAIAVMLAEYEIEGRKLLDGLDENARQNRY